MNHFITLSSALALSVIFTLPFLGRTQCIPATNPYGASQSSSQWTGRSQHIVNEINRCFPTIFTCGGQTRPNSPTSDHSRGNAMDCFPGPFGVMHFGVDKDEGDQLAAWAVEHATKLRIYYVIWYRHIWTFSKASEGWRDCKFGESCDGETGVTAMHLDHIHISVYGSDRSNPDYSNVFEPGLGRGPPPELRCETPSGSGTCVSTASCAARVKTSIPNYCPGPTDFQCCV